MRYVLLLFLVACSSTPHLLADGAPLAPVEPRVTYTPTGTGLPEYWGTPEAPRVERSPHTRVLPQTPATQKEPGIWASDGARVPAVPMIAGVALPYPPGTEVDDQKLMGRLCAAHMTKAIANTGVIAQIKALKETDRICIAMRMYEHCTSLTRAFTNELARTRPDQAPAEWVALVSAYDRTAKSAMARECQPPRRPPEESGILNAVLPEYDRIINATGL